MSVRNPAQENIDMSRRQNRPAFFATSALLVSALCIVAAAKTIYVDDDVTGANDGTSWSDAYVYLQEALADARLADQPVEIRVAQGIYRPNEGLVAIPEFDWRTTTFQLINGVTLKGGYAGSSEPNPNVCDAQTYETILSGDLAGNDAPNVMNNDENSYHVVTGNDTDATSVLDGFTITAGNASGDYPLGHGGGMHNVSGSPTLVNCTFRSNGAVYGGGMHNLESNPNITDCTFTNNIAYFGYSGTYPEGTAYGGWGAGMHNDTSSPTLSRCIFTGNNSDHEGGGMYNEGGSRPILTNCTFSENFALDKGGGVFNWESQPTLANCAFSGNLAGNYGGGMRNTSCNPTVTNCTFTSNFAYWGGGISNAGTSNPMVADSIFTGNSAYGGGGIFNGYSSPRLINCTFIENSAHTGGAMRNSHTSSPTLTDCTFSNNLATGDGAGMFNSETSDSMLTRCVFRGNSAERRGGGMGNYASSSPMLINCIFSENVALVLGGGMYNHNASPTIANCTFTGNAALSGNATACDSYRHSRPSNIRITNSILWDGAKQIWNNDNSTISITHSDWQGLTGDRSGLPGSNINEDPCFADPANGDYHLKSEAGRWDPNSQSWIKDDVTSPCIDAGDPNSDWTSETWPHGGRVNMGAYGGTRQASLSPRPEEMSLPRVAYIHEREVEAAESFRSLLVSYGCSATLIGLDDVATTPLDSYDLVIVGNDTGSLSHWGDADSVAAIESSGKPVVGLGEGGYAFFGKLGLWVGWPNGMHSSRNSLSVIDTNSSLFSVPYPIDVPENRALQLNTETGHVGLHLWPVPETVTALGGEVDSPGYYPLALEHDRYVLWGFTESPENMTQVGKTLFVNVVIRAANTAW